MKTFSKVVRRILIAVPVLTALGYGGSFFRLFM
jgi:hypothetical protein